MFYKFLLFDLDHTLLDFDTAEDVALTQLLKEEGVADIQAYKDYYVPMNKALWKDLELKKISKQELVNTRFSRLFAHFGQEKDGSFLAQRYQFYLAQQGQTLLHQENALYFRFFSNFDDFLEKNYLKTIWQVSKETPFSEMDFNMFKNISEKIIFERGSKMLNDLKSNYKK